MKHFSELSASAERVVDAAEGLIQQRGYNGFSYDDVARIVGIKKPSIHHHFPTKAELACVVAQRYAHRFRGELLRIEGQHASALDRLTAYAALFEQTFSNHRRLCLCGMLGAEAESLPEELLTQVQQFFQVNLDWLATAFTEGQRQKLIRPTLNPAALSEAYFCALEGSMVVGRGMKAPHGPGELGNHFISTVLA